MRIVKCNKCGKLKNYYAKGFCRTCYINQRLMHCTVMGHSFNMSFPLSIISKEEAKEYFVMKRNEFFVDVINNPGKYLK